MLRTYHGDTLGFGLDSVTHMSWDRWAGSPALVARVADQIRDLAASGPGDGDFRIEIRVRDDVEVYSSPEDFRQNVPPESLRDFSWLAIGFSASLLDVQFILRRVNWATKIRLRPLLERWRIVGPWAEWAETWDRGDRPGGAWRLTPDAAFLSIESRDAAVDPREVGARVARTAGRGSPSRAARIAGVAAPAVVAIVAFESLAYLFADTWDWLHTIADDEHASLERFLVDWEYTSNVRQQIRDALSRQQLAFGLVYASLVLVSYLAVRLVLPQSEIADPGKTRARQLLRTAGGVATALLVTALTKRVFGS